MLHLKIKKLLFIYVIFILKLIIFDLDLKNTQYLTYNILIY